jgi:hypothetical protein
MDGWGGCFKEMEDGISRGGGMGGVFFDSKDVFVGVEVSSMRMMATVMLH